LNRFFTFGRFESGMSRQKEFLAYFVLMLGGGMVNYAIYVALVSFSQLVGQMPIIGVAAGSIGGLLINYASSSLLYRRHQ
jgi:putative flippase GtrA